MDPSNQEVYFVELEGLDGETYSEVINILHGTKQNKKIEFPWEHKLEKNKDAPEDLQLKDASVPPKDVLVPQVELPQMMVPYAMVPGIVPIPAVVATPYLVSQSGLVNGVPGPYQHGYYPDGSILQPDCIIDMPSPAKLDMGPNYTNLSHCNGPVVPPAYKLQDVSPPQMPVYNEIKNHKPHYQSEVSSDIYVPHSIEMVKDHNHSKIPNTAPQNNKNSLHEAIKSSRIFSQVLGSSEPSTGLSFLTDDSLADDSGIYFLGEDQIGEADSSKVGILQEISNDYVKPDDSIENIEVTVSINNHKPIQTQLDCTEYSETVCIQPSETEKEAHDLEKEIKTTDKETCQEPTVSHVQTQLPVAAKSKSWAGLFKATPSRATVLYANEVPNVSAPIVAAPIRSYKKKDEVLLPIAASEDSATSELGALLSHIKLNHASVALKPRGLINNSNWCYINSTLQALIACPPFYHLMKKLSEFPPMSRGSSSTPILDSLLQFTSEFQVMPRHYETNGHRYEKNRKNFDIEPGQDFEPKYVHNMLHVIEVNPAFKLGKQEDAEEFLSILLDGLHEEMAAAINTLPSKDRDVKNQPNGAIDEVDDDDEDDDSWEQVGPKNKSVVTRLASFSKTPISDIFAGQMRSVVSKTGSKESATLQLYFTLQLDIQGKVFSVRDALEGLVSKEIVEDYFDKKTNQKIEIMRKTTLEELPPVLILHLKCFVYNNEGSQKLLKNIDFDVDLKITKDLISSTSKIPVSHKSYKLFAVVYHHGVKSTGGHYTTVVFHPGINGWIHIDDRRIENVSVQKVFKYTPPRMPYLLYYRRTDLTYS